MRVASVGSGSKGNALLVEYENTTLLIDCGFSFSKLKLGVERLNKRIEDIDAVFVTHEHGDHIRGLQSFAKKSAVPIYMSYGTAEASNNTDLPYLKILSDSETVELGSLSVLPVTVPHDSREPFQFVIRQRAKNKSDAKENGSSIKNPVPASLGVLTDLGSIPAYVQNIYAQCDALVIEANHDEQLLQNGSYPYSLKKRVGGDWGHLSNRQTAEFLANVDQDKLQWMVVAHISEQNNCPDRLSQTMSGQVRDTSKIYYAQQDEGFDWLEVESIQ